MTPDQGLRDQLLVTLQGQGARITFDDVVADVPQSLWNANPSNAPYTLWHILEHIRICQWDILEYVRNPDYVSPEWPVNYWPAADAKADQAAWDRTIAEIRRDLKDFEDMVKDTSLDIYAPIPHGVNSHTILREILLVADHNAYHIGEFSVLKSMLEAARA